MARAKRGARSQAVRDYLKAHPQAGPKEIVDGLKSQGVTVSVGLVRGIKYRGKRAGSRKPAKPHEPASMSDAIRGYLTQHPDAKPAEVRVALAKQGIKVGSRLISDVKRDFEPKRRAPKVHVAVRKTSVAPIAIEPLQGEPGADPVTILPDQTLPAAKRLSSRLIYSSCYSLSYGIVFPILLAANLVPAAVRSLTARWLERRPGMAGS